eukprot:SAG31_NODE_3808_length_3863_cov_4.036663_6_plen_215_part_00
MQRCSVPRCDCLWRQPPLSVPIDSLWLIRCWIFGRTQDPAYYNGAGGYDLYNVNQTTYWKGFCHKVKLAPTETMPLSPLLPPALRFASRCGCSGRLTAVRICLVAGDPAWRCNVQASAYVCFSAPLVHPSLTSKHVSRPRSLCSSRPIRSALAGFKTSPYCPLSPKWAETQRTIGLQVRTLLHRGTKRSTFLHSLTASVPRCRYQYRPGCQPHA